MVVKAAALYGELAAGLLVLIGVPMLCSTVPGFFSLSSCRIKDYGVGYSGWDWIFTVVIEGYVVWIRPWSLWLWMAREWFTCVSVFNVNILLFNIDIYYGIYSILYQIALLILFRYAYLMSAYVERRCTQNGICIHARDTMMHIQRSCTGNGKCSKLSRNSIGKNLNWIVWLILHDELRFCWMK